MNTSPIRFDTPAQLPKDAIMVTCESGEQYLTFRIGSEICAAIPETLDTYLCKSCGELEYLPTMTFLDDMGDCMQMYCLYYYGEKIQDFPCYSIPERYDASPVGADPLVLTTSFSHQYLVFLDKQTVKALDLRTGYQYECKNYLDLAEYIEEHSFPFHDDMRECYAQALDIYGILEEPEIESIQEKTGE